MQMIECARLMSLLGKKLDIIAKSDEEDKAPRIKEIGAELTDIFETLVGIVATDNSFPLSLQALLVYMQLVMTSMSECNRQTADIILYGDKTLGITALSELFELLTADMTDKYGELWPYSEAESFASELKLGGLKQVVCMFGYGDGTYARAISDDLTDDSVIITYEPGTDDVIGLRDDLQNYVDFYMLEGMKVVCHPMYDRVFKTEYAEFLHAINNNRERVLVNKNTLARFKEASAKNVLKNLCILKDINLVTELSKILPRDVPVIIVSAGPSLDKNIELLRKAKGHSLIFAVDTAMKYLLKKDIVPDLGITVEPIKPMANYEDERCFDIPHVFDGEANPEIVGKHRSRKFIYNCRDYMRNLLVSVGKEVPSLIASGGSVATVAFAICYELRMKNIIMIGQDLAYAGTATHAGGVESAGINGDIGYTMIEGIDGGEVRTRSDWLGYLRWFENAISVIKDTECDIDVIDATEGGALIHGSSVLTLKEVIETMCVHEDGTSICDYNFEEKLLELKPYLSEPEFKRVEANERKAAAELMMTKAAADEAVEKCDKILMGKGTQEDVDFLVIARKSCESALMYPLINNYAVSDIADEVSRLRLDTSDPASTVKQQRVAFAAISGAVDYLMGVLGDISVKK